MMLRLRSLMPWQSRLPALGMCIPVWLLLLCPPSEAGLQVVKFGWNELYQPGRWTALRVSVTEEELSQDAQFEIIAADAEGNLNHLRQPGIATGREGEFELRFRLGRIGSEIRIRLLDGGEVRAETVFQTARDDEALPAALSLNRHLMGVLTSQQDFISHLKDFYSDPEARDDEPIQLVPLASAAELPLDTVSWSSLEVLILSSEMSLSASQSRTLQQWVSEGGHLILSLNSDPGTFTKSPLAGWIPVDLGESLRLRDLSQFESYVGRGSRITFTGRVDALELARYRGNEILDSLDGTLIAALDYGFGMITVSGVDLTQPPLADWESSPRLIRKLAFPAQKQTEREEDSATAQLTDTGISELATQLNLAQQDFPEVYRSNTWIVIGAIALYALLIGPLDYLIVHRVFKRPELTWVTFPLLLGLTAVVTVWAGRMSNEAPLTVNQVDLVDIDERQDLVRVRSWMTFYNSQTQRVAVESSSNLPGWSASEDITAQHPVLTWNAVPEDGFGGLYRQSGLEFSRAAYHQETAFPRIDDLPIEQWSTRSLITDHFLAGAPLVESDLEASTLGSIQGTFVHQLPGELVDWMLVYRRRVYYPRPTRTRTRGIAVPPGQPVELTRSDLSASRDLKGYLTGTRQIQVKSNEPGKDTRIVYEQEAYDPFSTDPRQILRMLSFHEAAGGHDYTKLQNSALYQFDWSPQLHPRQAVFYGVLRSSEANLRAVDWTLNGESIQHDSQTTIVRCLLPVRLKNDERRELPQLDDD